MILSKYFEGKLRRLSKSNLSDQSEPRTTICAVSLFGVERGRPTIMPTCSTVTTPYGSIARKAAFRPPANIRPDDRQKPVYA